MKKTTPTSDNTRSKEEKEYTELKKSVFALLNEIEPNIVDFSNKCAVGGFLRLATLSHIRTTFRVPDALAVRLFNDWLTEEQ